MADYESVRSNGLANDTGGPWLEIATDSADLSAPSIAVPGATANSTCPASIPAANKPGNSDTEGIIPGSVYRIHNKSCPSRSVELYFGSSAKNTPVQIWDTIEDEHFFRQLWIIKPVEAEEQISYIFQNLRSGTQMELFNGFAQNGTRVHGQPVREPTPEQGLWQLLPSADGYWRVKNKASNSYLELCDGGSSNLCDGSLLNGTTLQGWQFFDDDRNQFWGFERMSRSPLEIQEYLARNDLVRNTHFHRHLANDHQYLAPPKAVVERVWRGGHSHIPYEPDVFNSDSFAIGFKAAMCRAISDLPLRAGGFGILCGIMFVEGAADHGGRALNWFCLKNGELGCMEISFFEPETGIWDKNAFGHTKFCFGLY